MQKLPQGRAGAPDDHFPIALELGLVELPDQSRQNMARQKIEIIWLPASLLFGSLRRIRAHQLRRRTEISIRDLAETVQEVVGHQGRLVFDTSKPDGTPRKVMDSSRLRQLGWAPTINLKDGISSTYQRFLKNQMTAQPAA